MNKNSSKKKDDISCVQLSRQTKAKLDKLGTKADTYDSVIRSLMPEQDAVEEDETS
jgi:hypothetical protein